MIFFGSFLLTNLVDSITNVPFNCLLCFLFEKIRPLQFYQTRRIFFKDLVDLSALIFLLKPCIPSSSLCRHRHNISRRR